jgi:hypothetical protein
MICFKDMTFCTYYKNCSKADKCHRPLTKKVKEDAKKWMKNPPICQFTEKPDCHSNNLNK